MALPTNPKDHRIKTNTPLPMGKLLKTWATGRDYVTKPQFPIPDQPAPAAYQVPRSFKEFVQQCVSVGVTLTYDDVANSPVEPDDQMGLVVLQGDTGVLVIRLSPADYVTKSEQQLVNGTTYPLTQHYLNVLVDPTLKTEAIDTPLHRLETHASAIADYTIRHCM